MLKRRKPTSPGIRWRKTPYINLNSSKKLVKGLKCKLPNNTGITSSGKKVARFRCTRKKSVYFNQLDNANLINRSAVVVSIFKSSYKTNLTACLQYTTGSFAYRPATYGSYIGSIVNVVSPSLHIRYLSPSMLTPGSSIFLGLLNRFTIISNITLNGSTKPKYVRSAGTYTIIEEILSEVGLSIVRLPTGSSKLISNNSFVTIGRNSNIAHKYTKVGKAGFNKNKGKSQTTRGVAMNPVDHPNGGRTKTNKPEKSLWGWIAKRGS